MKRRKTSKSPTGPKNDKTIKQTFPPGWNEKKIRAVLRHYEELTDEELAREIEMASEVTGETLISVPTELLPAVGRLIVRHRRSA